MKLLLDWYLYQLKYIFNKNRSKKGTMGLEIIEQVPDVDAIVVPTGGAGLLAGIIQNRLKEKQ